MKPRTIQVFSQVLFIVILLQSGCKHFSPNKDDVKLREVEKLQAGLPIHPTFQEIGGSSFSKPMLASIHRYYKSDAGYDVIKSFYSAKLIPEGWQLTKERSLKDWSVDLGGRQLKFGKGQYSVTIEYSGDKALDPDWNYAISVGWYNVGWGDK